MSLLDVDFIEKEFVSFRSLYKLIGWDSPILGGDDNIVKNNAPYSLYTGYSGINHSNPMYDMIMNRLEKIPLVLDRFDRLRMDRSILGNEILDMFDDYLHPDIMKKIRKSGVFVEISSTKTEIYYMIRFHAKIKIDFYRSTDTLFRFTLRIN